MSTHSTMAVFGSADEARRAREALLASGFEAACIDMSPDFSRDGIAAEAPGQSVENQGSGGEGDPQAARTNTSVRSASCTLTVAAGDAHGEERARAVLERCGARTLHRT